MHAFHSLQPEELSPFLERYRVAMNLGTVSPLDTLLVEILRKASEFVPSEAGSILLDDPRRKRRDRALNELRFISTFGPGSEKLLDRVIEAQEGIAGHVYLTGEPYLSKDVLKDALFKADIDKEMGFIAKSIVAVPVYIGKEVCGVLELINRKGDQRFHESDRELLEIFAGYTSFTLQNALDARRAHELARRDDLTGLYNDRYLHQKLETSLEWALNNQSELTALFIDLDRFKEINDNWGHLAGSQVLREVAFLLTRAVDSGDVIISRYGGDEFVLIAPGSTLEEGVEMAGAIRKAIEDHVYVTEDHGFGVPALHLRNALSASIGIASIDPNNGLDGKIGTIKNDLLRRADSAMYAAKEAGRAQAWIHDGEGLRRA
ncbi:MAG: sensor domain-containing diguanylate cyclase [Acidobacteria bacterium]|nr:sensor domain-containing diguanylate cyclase [Acidobacteriota bacterium]